MASAKKGKKRPTIKVRRAAKKAAIEEVLASLTAERARALQALEQTGLLTSVAEGLYEEVDKLAKKAPFDEATDLVVEHVNDVIHDVRELAAADAYVQRIKPFVPAGDNPEHRDVLLILKQLRQGLARVHGALDERLSEKKQHLPTARGLVAALEIYLTSGETQITDEELALKDAELDSTWFMGTYDFKYVNLPKIDQLDVQSYFDETG